MWSVLTAHHERLLTHAHWADQRLLACLRDAPTPDTLRLFAHVLTTEHLYLERMREHDPWPQDFWPDLSLNACATRCEENRVGYQDFLAHLDATDLGAPVRYRTSGGTVHRTPIHDMLTHVVLHGSHHRGQIAAQLRAASVVPVNVDFITFVREGG